VAANSTAARLLRKPAVPVLAATAPAAVPDAASRAVEKSATAMRMVVPKPVFRKLRVFGVDPDVASRFETALLNEMTLRIPWEDLKPGPRGVGRGTAFRVDIAKRGSCCWALTPSSRHQLSRLAPWPRETGLAGWAWRTRTQKCRRKLSL